MDRTQNQIVVSTKEGIPFKLVKGGAAVRLRQDLVDQIRNGNLGPDDPVMPAHQLSAHYGISYQTVHRVLSKLVKEGLIYRVQGRGTFVADPKARHDVVGAMMRCEGDLFGTMFAQLSRRLQAEGLVCMGAGSIPNDMSQIPDEHLEDVLKFQPDALVVEGIGHFPFQALKARERSIPHMIFIHELETDMQFTADAVLSDYERGGYLATRHLLELGHRRLAVEIYGPAASNALRWQSIHDKLRGVFCACREFGVPPEQVDILEGVKDQRKLEKLRVLLQSSNPPTAVLAASDYKASLFLTLMRSLGIDVPGDVSVMGYFNTSWCEGLDIALSSVSIREDILAKRVADCILEKRKHPNTPCQRLQIEPEVIPRASTGPLKHPGG